jgi:hypothetical protein
MPAGAVAFQFNLYEGHGSVHVQLDGIDSFNVENDDSLGESIFSTGEDIFEVPFQDAGADWQEWLQSLMALCKEYVLEGERSDVLRGSRGVGIGFADGDLHVLWERA